MPDPVGEALSRLSAALDRLDAAAIRHVESDRVRATLVTELAVMREDRHRLAEMLDLETGRALRRIKPCVMPCRASTVPLRRSRRVSRGARRGADQRDHRRQAVPHGLRGRAGAAICRRSRPISMAASRTCARVSAISATCARRDGRADAGRRGERGAPQGCCRRRGRGCKPRRGAECEPAWQPARDGNRHRDFEPLGSRGAHRAARSRGKIGKREG